LTNLVNQIPILFSGTLGATGSRLSGTSGFGAFGSRAGLGSFSFTGSDRRFLFFDASFGSSFVFSGTSHASGTLGLATLRAFACVFTSEFHVYFDGLD
jgi:hypothetical protein